MTETENRNPHAARQPNGGAMAESSTVEDVFDDTYREKDGPKPPRRLVWRNIILMSLLHAGALYGLVLLPSASGLTLQNVLMLVIGAGVCPNFVSTPALHNFAPSLSEMLSLCVISPGKTKHNRHPHSGAIVSHAAPQQNPLCQPEPLAQLLWGSSRDRHKIKVCGQTWPTLTLTKQPVSKHGSIPEQKPGCHGKNTLSQGLSALWAAVCYLVSALGVTAGAHRLWSHRSYKASFPLRVFLAVANSMSFQNDIFEWARDHRVHHKFSETDADPHNAKRGFFFAHIGWLLVRKHPDVIEKGKKLDLSDLKADAVVMFQRRHYKLSVVVLCFLLPMLVPWYFWGESLAVGYFVPGLLRYSLILNATWLVNSAAHIWGNRPYDKTINPRENFMVALSAIGEGFHNYHHTFPFDYATSEFGCKLNLTTAFIDFMCFLGLARDRKSVSKDAILTRVQRTGDGSYKSG
ncbi:Acyl-CoA desaturase [Takifugu flavidus]|uniref:stearoyl-CoA 9-desaturase n=1 Tax=Takifugu flavidus TaxID=433684 RepID=A0A5C6PHW6_9TELE|nr:Acyl-CoA desaturase [Takifugu flavidus]